MTNNPFENRVMMSNPSCYTCKQCVYGQRDPRSALPEVGLCMLGSPESDKNRVQKYVDEMDEFAARLPGGLLPFLNIPDDKTRSFINSPRYVTEKQACQYFRRRDLLDERNLRCVPTCHTCNYCLVMTAWDEEEEDDTVQAFCTLGLSKEDQQLIVDELESCGFQAEEAFSATLLELMQLESGCKDVLLSQRLVNDHLCCQLYEGSYSEEKTNAET